MSSHQSLSRRVFVTILGMSLTTIIVFALALTLIVQSASSMRRAPSSPTRPCKCRGFAQQRPQPSHHAASTAFGEHPRHPGRSRWRCPVRQRYRREQDGGPCRPSREFEQAISTGYGSAERSSTTLGEVMLYQAVRLADGSVVRIAEGEAGYLAILGTLSLPVVLMVVGGAVVAVVVARRESHRIIEPLLEVDS